MRFWPFKVDEFVDPNGIKVREPYIMLESVLIGHRERVGSIEWLCQQKVFPRLRPISLEFGPKTPDHRVVLDHEDPHIDPAKPDLGDSIDDLLDELDVARADQDDGSSVESDDASVTNDTTEVDESVEHTNISETLDALDSVSDAAEMLLGESIDKLLDDAPAEEIVEHINNPDDSARVEETSEHFDEIDIDVLDSIADSDNQLEESINHSEDEDAGDADLISSDVVDEIAAIEDMLESVNNDLIEHAQETERNDDSVQSIESTPVDVTSTPALPEIEAEIVDDVTEKPAPETTSEDSNTTEQEPESEAASVETSDQAEVEISQLHVDDIAEAVADTDAPELIENLPAANESPEVDELDSMLMGTLDDQLASMGDDLLMGDFETPEGELIESSAIENEIDPALLLDQLNITDAQPTEHLEEASDQIKEPDVSSTSTQSSETDPSPTAETPVVESAVASSSTTQDVQPASSVTHRVTPTQSVGTDAESELVDLDIQEPEIESIWEKLLHTSKSLGTQGLFIAKTKAAPIAARGLLMMSKPLATKPAELRNSIGWVALWTIFLACTLWGYVLFFRTSTTPTPMQAPSRVITPGESLEPIEHQINTESP